MSFTSSKLNQEFSAWQSGQVLANPAHEMRTNTRTELFTSKLPLAGALFCAIAVMVAASANAGPEKWASKDKNVAVAQEEPFSWTGLYMGVHVGGTWSQYDLGGFDTDVNVFEQRFGFIRDPVGPNDVLSFSTPAIDAGSIDSVIGGGQIGYNFQFGHFVFGVEGDFSGMNTGRTDVFRDTADSFFFLGSTSAFTQLTTERDVETNWMGSGRGRLGWAQGPVLLYVTGGVAFAEVGVSEYDRAATTFFVPGQVPPLGAEGIPPNSVIITRTDRHGVVHDETVSRLRNHDDSVQIGWTGGGGVEWAPHNNWSIAMEYRHSEFGDENYHFSSLRGPIFPVGRGNTRAELSNDQVTIRVNLLLGHVMSH